MSENMCSCNRSRDYDALLERYERLEQVALFMYERLRDFCAQTYAEEAAEKLRECWVSVEDGMGIEWAHKELGLSYEGHKEQEMSHKELYRTVEHQNLKENFEQLEQVAKSLYLLSSNLMESMADIAETDDNQHRAFSALGAVTAAGHVIGDAKEKMRELGVIVDD